MTVKMCGYEITKGKVEAYVSVGVGGEAKVRVRGDDVRRRQPRARCGRDRRKWARARPARSPVYPDNIQRVAHSLFYVGYLRLMGENQKAYTWKTYFRELEDNRILLVKANGELSKLLEAVELERVLMGSRLGAWKEMEALARFSRAGAVPGLIPAGRRAPMGPPPYPRAGRRDRCGGQPVRRDDRWEHP